MHLAAGLGCELYIMFVFLYANNAAALLVVINWLVEAKFCWEFSLRTVLDRSFEIPSWVKFDFTRCIVVRLLIWMLCWTGRDDVGRTSDITGASWCHEPHAATRTEPPYCCTTTRCLGSTTPVPTILQRSDTDILRFTQPPTLRRTDGEWLVAYGPRYPNCGAVFQFVWNRSKQFKQPLVTLFLSCWTWDATHCD